MNVNSKYQLGGNNEDLDLYSSNFFSNIISQLSTQREYESAFEREDTEQDRDLDDNPYTQEDYEDLLARYEDLSERYNTLSTPNTVSYNKEFDDNFLDFLFQDDSKLPIDFSQYLYNQNTEDTVKGLYERAKPFQGMAYGFGSEGQNNRIDCSAYTCKVINQPRTTSEEILKNSKNLRTYSGTNNDIQEGTVIGFDMGRTRYDAGRKMGIDHVGVVVRNPETGELEFTESVSKKGVTNRPLNEALESYKKRAKNIYLGEYQLGGYINVDSVLNANKHIPFVDRILNAGKYPVYKNKDGKISTHLMAYADNFVYPTLRYVDGKWIQNNDPSEALKAGDFIKFETPEQADYFSRNYKNSKLSKIPKRNTGGIANTFEELYNGLNNSHHTQMTLNLPPEYNIIRGLDSGEPVHITDQLGNEDVLYGPYDMKQMFGKVYENKL